MTTQKTWNKLDKKVQIWATRIGAIATIIGALATSGVWLIHQVDNSLAIHLEKQTSHIQEEIDDIKAEQSAIDKQTEVQLTRLELMTLIDSDPNNIIAIEKLAIHYFRDLGANSYISEVYTRWAKKYGGDLSIVVK